MATRRADRRRLLDREGRGCLVTGAVIAFILLLPVLTFRGSEPSDDGDGVETPTASGPMGPAAVEDVGTLVGVAMGRTDAPQEIDPWLGQELGPVYAGLRDGGVHSARAWGTGPNVAIAVVDAVSSALEDLADADAVDAVEVCISHGEQPIVSEEDERFLTNAHMGILGFELRHGDETERISPTEMVASNRTFHRITERFLEFYELDAAPHELGRSIFQCEQVLVRLSGDGGPSAVRMVRGDLPVEPEDVDHTSTRELRDLLGGWLQRAVHEDGRMTYKYWPSRGEESDANNMIRQWMASVALVRLAADLDDPSVLELATRNIEYNLDNHYRLEDDLGVIIEWDGSVKLGALALAALTLIEHPDDERFAAELDALLRTVDQLWKDDGSFDTFLRPEGRRRDNVNFYPGEALVMLAALHDEEPDEDLRERFERSFRYYRSWHLDPDNRNPAFVPWHTQAYEHMWQQTGDEELRDFVFEMNDWLLPMQQWDDAPYSDMRGRFYEPDRPDFGPPHSSSTGVYLEGLIAAYDMARAVGDDERIDAYGRAIRRGLRSVQQLTYHDDVDTFYVSKEDRVLGGVRTTVYDNEIRVDNIQHPLMAVMRIIDVSAGDPDLLSGGS